MLPYCGAKTHRMSGHLELCFPCLHASFPDRSCKKTHHNGIYYFKSLLWLCCTVTNAFYIFVLMTVENHSKGLLNSTEMVHNSYQCHRKIRRLSVTTHTCNELCCGSHFPPTPPLLESWIISTQREQWFNSHTVLQHTHGVTGLTSV